VQECFAANCEAFSRCGALDRGETGWYGFHVPTPLQLPRLTRPDVDDLRRVCGQLDAAAAVLVQSGWSGKFPVLTMLDQAKQTIAGLYNRSEPAYLDQLARKSARMRPGGSGEGGTGESSSSAPGAAPGSLET
jgi:hypothetical protein